MTAEEGPVAKLPERSVAHGLEIAVGTNRARANGEVLQDVLLAALCVEPFWRLGDTRQEGRGATTNQEVAGSNPAGRATLEEMKSAPCKGSRVLPFPVSGRGKGVATELATERSRRSPLFVMQPWRC